MVDPVKKAYEFIMTEEVTPSAYWSTRVLSGESQWQIITNEDCVYVHYSKTQDSNYEIVDKEGISSQDMSDAICLILEELGIAYLMWKIPDGWQIGSERGIEGISKLRSKWSAEHE
jgi:hypothetical protein